MRGALRPGDFVGTYQVDELIGAGRVSQVWRAHLSSEDRHPVALKILHEREAPQELVRDLFRREADLLMRLRSPQIVRAYSFALSEGVPFIVMELLRGDDLQSVLRHQGPLPITKAIAVIIEVLKALSELHRQGVVHGDLKPENIFLLSSSQEQTPRVKIIDLSGAAYADRPLEPRLTEGTYLYMAPEQLRGEPLGPATDLYGVAALTFALISGRPPFTPTLADGLEAHLSQPTPRLSDRVPNVPEALERLLALALGPMDKRPTSADLMRRTLERCLSDLSQRPQPADSFLPAELPSELPSHASTPQTSAPQLHQGQPLEPSARAEGSHETPQTPGARLRALLKEHLSELTDDWARCIAETLQFGRLPLHTLKVNVSYYLNLFSQARGDRLPRGFDDLIEAILSHLNFKSPDLAPLLTGSLLVTSLHPYMRERSDEEQDQLRGAIYHLFYIAQQGLIEALIARYPQDFEPKLRALFSRPLNEHMGISTLEGLLRYSQPELRSVFAVKSDAELRQRNLFELLSAYEGLHELQRDFRSILRGEAQRFSRPLIMRQPNTTQRVLTLKVSPHLLKRGEMSGVMLFFEPLEERQVIDPLSPEELSEDYGPQAPLWVETRGVESVPPDLLPSLEALGEDEPTPIPGVISPPSSSPSEPLFTFDVADVAEEAHALEVSPDQSSVDLDPTAPYDRLSSSELPRYHGEERAGLGEAEERAGLGEVEDELPPHAPQERDVSAHAREHSERPIDLQELHTPDYRSPHSTLSASPQVQLSAPPREVSDPQTITSDQPIKSVTTPSPDVSPRVQHQSVERSVDSRAQRTSQRPYTVTYHERQKSLHQLHERRHAATQEEPQEIFKAHTVSLQPQAHAQPTSYPVPPPAPEPSQSMHPELSEMYPEMMLDDQEPRASQAPRVASASPRLKAVVVERASKESQERQRSRMSAPPHPHHPTPRAEGRADVEEVSPYHEDEYGQKALTMPELPSLEPPPPRAPSRAPSTRPSPIDISQRPKTTRLDELSQKLNPIPPEQAYQSSGRYKAHKREQERPSHVDFTPESRLSNTGPNISVHILGLALLLTLTLLLKEKYISQRSTAVEAVKVSSGGAGEADAEQGAASSPAREAQEAPSQPTKSSLPKAQVRLVLNARASVYEVRAHQPRVELCSMSFVCDVSVDQELIVVAQGHYERPLYPSELKEHPGAEWQISLIKSR